MNKTIQCIAAAITLLSSSAAFSAAQTPVEDRHAVEISIGGNGAGVDQTAYRKLRSLIGNAVANSVIDKFVIYGYGREGGFSGCVEDRPSTAAPSPAFENFVKKLNTLRTSPDTNYSVNRVKTCPASPVLADKPATVRVAKADGSIACEPGSGTALSEMQKELGGIIVYSSTKIADGLMRPAVCGIPTGQYNVYEIAETDLDQAVGLGFTVGTEISAPQQTQVAQAGAATALTSATTYNQFVIGTLTGTIFGAAVVYTVTATNQYVMTCYCHPSVGGNPVTWSSSPAGKEAECAANWINSGHNPNQCPI